IAIAIVATQNIILFFFIVVVNKGLIKGFSIPYKIIQDRLPAGLLHLYGIHRFGVKRGFYIGLITFFLKQSRSSSPIRHRVGNLFMQCYPFVNTFKIKTKPAIFGFHSVLKTTSGSQIIFTFWTMPAGRSEEHTSELQSRAN